MTTNGNGNGNLLEAEAFAARVEQTLGAMPEIAVLERSGMELKLRVHGSEMRLNLENFYNAYLLDPSKLEAIHQTMIRTMQGFNPDRSAESFDELRERIYPMLKPAALVTEIQERNLPMLVYRAFLANLVIAYVIDEPDSVAFINEEHMEHWEIGEHALYQQALQNLRERTLNTTDYTTVGTGAQQLFIFSSQDGYDATRILLPELLDKWRSQLPGNMVIGIPNRDFLIAFSDADRVTLMNIAQQVQIDSVQRSYSLTPQLFTLTEGEIRAYDLE
ncbi:MAG: DUF1444 family protein [Chloroflexaceae bacterium]